MSEQRIGKWMFTYTGAKFWPLDPRPEEMPIETIAYALSKQCRYAGHVTRFFSVAEHSIWITVAYLLRNAQWTAFSFESIKDVSSAVECAKRHVRATDPGGQEIITALWCLLHDAPETWLQDRIRPLKDLDLKYRSAEAKVEGVVAIRFDLPLPIPAEVHELDHRIVLDEVLWLIATEEECTEVFGAVDMIDWITDEEPIGIPGQLFGKQGMDEVAKTFLSLFRFLTARRPVFDRTWG